MVPVRAPREELVCLCRKSIDQSLYVCGVRERRRVVGVEECHVSEGSKGDQFRRGPA